MSATINERARTQRFAKSAKAAFTLVRRCCRAEAFLLALVGISGSPLRLLEK